MAEKKAYQTSNDRCCLCRDPEISFWQRQTTLRRDHPYPLLSLNQKHHCQNSKSTESPKCTQNQRQEPTEPSPPWTAPKNGPKSRRQRIQERFLEEEQGILSAREMWRSKTEGRNGELGFVKIRGAFLSL